MPKKKLIFKDAFDRPHLQPDWKDYSSFNPIIDEGPINRSARLRRERLADESTRYKRKK